MNKEELGELYKYLGILRIVIMQLRDKEREFDFFKEEEKAILTLLNTIPILEQHIKN